MSKTCLKFRLFPSLLPHRILPRRCAVALLLPVFLALFSALAVISCGGGGGGGDGDGDGNRITVDITEATASVGLGETFQFHVTVTNTDNKAVTWKVNDIPEGNNSVGTISSAGLYTAPVIMPSPNTVTIKAVSAQDISCSDTAVVTINGPMPPDVQPRTVTVPAGGTQQFTADMPVDWSVDGVSGTDPATWGTISDTGLYTAPLAPPWQGTVEVVGVSKDNPSLATVATVTIAFSNATLDGRYALRYRGFDGVASLYAVGSLQLNGHGTITSGTIDFLEPGSAPVTAACTGSNTYSVGADGRGAISLTLLPQGGGSTFSFPLRFVMVPGGSARVIGFDDTGSGWGNLDQQAPASFGTGISGTYVFQLDGLDADGLPHAIAGVFNGSGGTISSGKEDINRNGTVSANVSFTGTYTGFDASTGRGTVALDAGAAGETDFAYYLLGPGSFAFVSRDSGAGYVGMATQPAAGPFSDGSLAGDLVYFSTGFGLGPTAPAVAAGVFNADGAGTFTSGVMDRNLNGATSANVTASGTYTIASNGRGEATLAAGSATIGLAGRLLADSYLLHISTTADNVSTGQFLPASLPLSTSIIRGAWSLAVRGTAAAAGRDMAIRMNLDGAGNLSGSADVNSAGTLGQGVAVSGTYSVSANGRGEATITVGTVTYHFALYGASGRWLVFVPVGSGEPAAIGFAGRLF